MYLTLLHLKSVQMSTIHSDENRQKCKVGVNWEPTNKYRAKEVLQEECLPNNFNWNIFELLTVETNFKHDFLWDGSIFSIDKEHACMLTIPLWIQIQIQIKEAIAFAFALQKKGEGKGEFV